MNHVFKGLTYRVFPSSIVLLLCAKVKKGFSLQPCVLSLLCVVKKAVVESPTSLPHSLHGIRAWFVVRSLGSNQRQEGIVKP